MELLQGTNDSFDSDCKIVKDMCSVYRGDYSIAKEPKEFTPVMRTPTMMKLLDKNTLFHLENWTAIKIAGGKTYHFQIQSGEKYLFQRPVLRAMDVRQDKENPMKFSWFMA